MKKKLTALLLVVVVVVALVGGATLSYFTDTGKVVNEFTVGNVDIDVYEHIPGNPNNATTTTGNTYSKVVPGVSYAKDPTIKNTGDNPAYVRMLVKVPKDVADAIGANNVPAMFKNIDTDKWTAGTHDTSGDPYVYVYEYKTTLEKNQTATLFTSFQLPTDIKQTGTKVITDFNIEVIGQAIQSEGFSSRRAALDELGNTLRYGT